MAYNKQIPNAPSAIGIARNLVRVNIIGAAVVRVYPEPKEVKLSFETQSGEKYKFDILPLVDFSKSKNIVSTDINDGEGEIIEIVSTKAWNINIKGKLIDQENHLRPEVQIRELTSFFKFNESVKVYSDLFEEKEISEILITDISLPSKEGFIDTQEFVINARSVTPLEISLLD